MRRAKRLAMTLAIVLIVVLGSPGLQAQVIDPFGLELPANPVPDHVTSVGGMAPHETKNFAQLDGPGCIRRIWFVQDRPFAPDRLLSHAKGSGIPGGGKPLQNRKMILRIYFDGAVTPQVEAPVGDFFGVMHGQDFYEINTPLISVKAANGYTSFFAMPFAKSARFEFVNGPDSSAVHLQIDWHRYPDQEMKESRRFCAQWRREMPATSYGDDYMILDAQGSGNLVGFFYGVRLIDNVDRWSHGGAENIYIDGQGQHPAFLRGLGGEDTFGTSFGGVQHAPESHLYDGLPYYTVEDVGEARGAQRLVGYRLYLPDPIRFKESIRFQFGTMANDICSTVYWYQTGERRPYVKLPDWPDLLPGAIVQRSDIDIPLPDGGTWGLSGLLDNRDGAAIQQALGRGGQRLPPGQWTDDLSKTDSTQWLLKSLVGTGDAAALQQALAQRGSERQKRSPGQRVAQSAWHGFVDFSRVHRTTLASKVTTHGRAAEAVTELAVEAAMEAEIRLTWDDHLVMRVNSDEPIDMGEHQHFRSSTRTVRLKPGRNSISILLSNEVGTNFGGWAFAFRATAPDGSVIMPRFQP